VFEGSHWWLVTRALLPGMHPSGTAPVCKCTAAATELTWMACMEVVRQMGCRPLCWGRWEKSAAGSSTAGRAGGQRLSKTTCWSHCCNLLLHKPSQFCLFMAIHAPCVQHLHDGQQLPALDVSPLLQQGDGPATAFGTCCIAKPRPQCICKLMHHGRLRCADTTLRPRGALVGRCSNSRTTTSSSSSSSSNSSGAPSDSNP